MILKKNRSHISWENSKQNSQEYFKRYPLSISNIYKCLNDDRWENIPPLHVQILTFYWTNFIQFNFNRQALEVLKVIMLEEKLEPLS